MDLDINSLFLVLDNLSYYDLYYFPIVNKYYMSLNKNSHYIRLLDNKRIELMNKYENYFRMFRDNIINIIKYVGQVSFNSDIIFQGPINYELYITRQRLPDEIPSYVFQRNISDTELESYVYNRIRNGDIITIMIERNLSSIPLIRDSIDRWKEIDPDIVRYDEDDEINIRINPISVINTLIKRE